MSNTTRQRAVDRIQDVIDTHYADAIDQEHALRIIMADLRHYVAEYGLDWEDANEAGYEMYKHGY